MLGSLPNVTNIVARTPCWRSPLPAAPTQACRPLQQVAALSTTLKGGQAQLGQSRGTRLVVQASSTEPQVEVCSRLLLQSVSMSAHDVIMQAPLHHDDIGFECIAMRCMFCNSHKMSVNR